MADKQNWTVRDASFAATAIVFVFFLHGTIPFLMIPTLGQAVWTTGFSQAFVNGPLFSIYAHDIGIPGSAAIAFGLAGAWPASLLIRLGLHPADAYAGMAALWLGVAFFSAYGIVRKFGGVRLVSLLGAVAWMSVPSIWAHAGYSMLSLGIGLLSFYFLSALRLFWPESRSNKILFSEITLYFLAAIVAVFMDGYTFMMFAVGSSMLAAYSYVCSKEQRRHLLKFAIPAHVIAFALAYLLYAAYIGKPQFDPAPLDFFRGWGLDLIFLVIPSEGKHWLWDILGLSVPRSNNQFFGDSSVWNTTFSLPLIIAGGVSWWLLRKKHLLANGFLLVAVFGFYMAMGPSIKINSVKPEPMGVMMPAELAIAPTGNALLSQYLPGFKNMRAAYRWSALGSFGLWVLLVLLLAQGKGKRAELLGAMILVALVVSYIPDLERNWHQNMRARESFKEIDRDLVNMIGGDLRQGELVAFLPYRNDFMINYLAPKLGVRTYNIGGDKNLENARQHWPKTMKMFQMGKVDPYFAERVLLLLARGEADVVVLPYIDMLWAAHVWPVPLIFADEMKPVLAALDRTGYVVLEKRKHYALVRLVSQFQGGSERGELERQLLFETCDSPYPVSVQDKSCSLDYVIGAGWHDLERAHVWSSKEAKLKLPVPSDCGPGECSVTLTISAYGASKARPVNVVFHD